MTLGADVTPLGHLQRGTANGSPSTDPPTASNSNPCRRLPARTVRPANPSLADHLLTLATALDPLDPGGYDLTGRYRAAAEFAGCEHVALREAGQRPVAREHRARPIDECLDKIEDLRFGRTGGARMWCISGWSRLALWLHRLPCCGVPELGQPC